MQNTISLKIAKKFLKEAHYIVLLIDPPDGFQGHEECMPVISSDFDDFCYYTAELARSLNKAGFQVIVEIVAEPLILIPALSKEYALPAKPNCFMPLGDLERIKFLNEFNAKY